ncbi:dystroglycan 1-like [Saccoglossus kowalevskii]|uniref:Dystroglycan 1 n=2 Tax=Saccoglossus kowalevskii TaxID=10224 RepID=A0ABM0GTJ0_SACKO|nr:PREDICTED: dystroglycan-like [Saccoglossus kowalevskii]
MPSVAETEALSTIPAMTSTPMTSSSAVMPSQLPPSAVIEPSRTYISQTDEPTQIVVTPTPVPTTLELTTTSEPLKPQITTGKTPLTTTSTVVKPNKVPLVRNPPIMPEIITGKVFKYQIPQNTFYDEEDGDTFNLKLVFTTSDGMPVPSDSWIQFNTNLQTLIGLPMKTDARQNNKYILTAVDSGGKIAIVPMDLDVTLSSLKKNHEFKISLVDGSKDLDNKVTTKVDIIERLATLYEDPTTDFISVSSFDKDSWTLGWSNNTQRYDPCPRKKIKLLTKVIEKMKGTPGVPSQALKEAMRPEYVVTRVEDTPFGPCTEEEIATTKAPPRIVSPVPTLTPNTAPILLNHIDRVVVYDGETFSYQIPQDTFYDAEDGVTPNLKLIFLTIEGVMMHKASWVQFNVTSQTLYGIPINRVGKYEYIMGAMDSGAKIARDAFEIEVVMNPHKPNYEFSVTLSNDITEFENDVFKTMDLVGRIAMLYGDDSNDAITVAYMKKGSTILGWSNNTMIYEPCPIEAIGKLAKLLETDKHQPTEIFINTLAPEYEVLSVSTSPIGPCVSPNKGTEAPEGPGIAESSGLTSDEEIWVITVVPALIVAAVLLLAGLIIFLCYRYSRKGKLSDEDEDTFIHKGVPVIFTDEMDDAEKPPSSASPLIMREEVPPVPPPEYPRQGSPSSNHPLLAHSFEDNADLDDTFFYQPPSGLSSTPDSRRSTPRNLRAYRPPPPYVPP